MIQAIELAQFHGTEGYTRGYMGVLMTDGVNYLTQYGANWLVTDAIVIVTQKLAQHDFIVIDCIINGGRATVTYLDGDNETLYVQEYEYTDLQCNVKMYYTDNAVMMLAGEY